MKMSAFDHLIRNLQRFTPLGFLLIHTGLASHGATLTNLPTLGGSAVVATALNERGQVAGFSLTAGNAQQHAFRFHDGVMVDLPTLGGTFSLANGLNSAGQVIGDSTTAGDLELHGFVTEGDAVIDLGTFGGSESTAVAINSAGWVTGHASLPGDFVWRAFLYTNGVVLPLDTLGGSSSYGVAINQHGHVAGCADTEGDVEQHPFLYRDGALTSLGTLGGRWACPIALNDAGQVVGESLTPSGETHAFLYTEGVMRDLGTLGGTYSTARAINQTGQVIGEASTPGDALFRAFLYTDGAMRDLGTLGGFASTAHAINDRGQVVGESADAAGRAAAFLYENGTMMDLNTLLPADSGWELYSARLINNAGQIVGFGSYLGQFQWFVFTPDAVNQPPVAQAGVDQTVECPDPVTLDGRNSSDPDGDTLTYEWRVQEVVLSTEPHAALRLPPGTYAIVLTVTDTHGATSTDSVEVNVVDVVPPEVVCLDAVAVPADAQGQGVVPDLAEAALAGDACTLTTALLRMQVPAPGTVVPSGTHVITVSVFDAAGNSGSCATRLTVGDAVAPVIVAPPPAITRGTGEDCSAVLPNLARQVEATDDVTPPNRLVRTQIPAPGTVLGPGIYIVEITVCDDAGNCASCVTTFTVVDRRRPVISALSATPSELPSGGAVMIPVRIRATATDNCDPAPECRIVDVRSHFAAAAWQITGPMTLTLRADPEGKRDRRLYTITVECTDTAGNTARKTVTVDGIKSPGKKSKLWSN